MAGTVTVESRVAVDAATPVYRLPAAPTRLTTSPAPPCGELPTVGRVQREALNGHPGKVIWFTGLSGAGKSTLANALALALHAQQRHTYILDGDTLRRGLNSDLGFTAADRVENMRRTMEVARLMLDAGLVVMVALISPFRRERELARAQIGGDNFLEVYVSTPLQTCEQRDTKGLYALARSGRLANMTGIDSAFEAPAAPELVLDCAITPLHEAVAALLTALAH